VTRGSRWEQPRDEHQCPRNPRTAEEARALVARVEALFMPWNIPALLDGFTDDCIVRFGDMPEFRGRAALKRLFRARGERQKNYPLRKEFRGSPTTPAVG
jgi:ketosteroid isomerase-like protein